MQISNLELGTGHCFVIAELSGNMGGSLETARQMVRVAKECGADAVKLQTFMPRDMPDSQQVVEGYGVKWDGRIWHDVYMETELPWPDQLQLKNDAAEWGIILFSTVCSKEAVDFWESHGGLPAYKIASWQCPKGDFARVLSDSVRKPIIYSVESMSPMWWHWYPLAKCPTEELPIPRKASHVWLAKDNLELITRCRNLRVLDPVGYSNHGPIDNCVEAVKRGAVIVEQHFTLSRDTIDYFAALPAEFGYMVREIRKVERWKNQYSSSHLDKQ
jgi:pseudaminic acid synthase